jgi:NADH:ubiquinone oxidoreductase subunit 6 (subunit J)
MTDPQLDPVVIAFAALVLGAAGVAAWVSSTRRAILALWVAGLAVGGIYLTLGAELLAVVQWVVSTLAAIAFLFFAVMFGEYRSEEREPARQRAAMGVVAGLAGAAFAAAVAYAAREITPAAPASPERHDLLAQGLSLVQQHLLSLEILGLTCLLVIVGGGVIARPEAGPGGGTGEGAP